MKKLILMLALCLGYATMAVADMEEYNQPSFRIGTWKGSSFEELTKTKFPQAQLLFFRDTTDDLIEALRNNQIDAFMLDRIGAKDLIKENPDLIYADEPLDRTQYAMSFKKDNQKLRDEFAVEVRKMKADGSLKKMQDAWFLDDDKLKISTVAPHGDRGLLRVGTSSVDAPFTFYMDNRLVGIEIELVNEIARRLNYAIEWSIVPHSEFISAVKEGKVDINAGLITITPERSREILFGEPDYEDIVVFVKRKK